MCNNVWGKGQGKRGEGRKGKVWLMKVRMETKEWNGKQMRKTVKVVWKGGAKVILRQSVEVESEMEHFATHTVYEGFLCYQIADMWRADICVGQLAQQNGISAQIPFHTSVDSPATLSNLNLCRQSIHFHSMSDTYLTHICTNTHIHAHTHTNRHTYNIVPLSVVINLSTVVLEAGWGGYSLTHDLPIRGLRRMDVLSLIKHWSL